MTVPTQLPEKERELNLKSVSSSLANLGRFNIITVFVSFHFVCACDSTKNKFCEKIFYGILSSLPSKKRFGIFILNLSQNTKTEFESLVPFPKHFFLNSEYETEEST